MATKETLVLLSAALVLGACDRPQDRASFGNTPSPTPASTLAANPSTQPRDLPAAPTPPPEQRATFTDVQSLAIVDASSSSTIDQAHEALRKTTNAAVKVLANEIIRSRAHAMSELTAIAKASSLAIEQTATSRELEADAKHELAMLRATPAGAEFDRHFLESLELEEHDLFLMLDATLVPSAHDPEMRRVLEKLRDDVRDQLAMTRDARSKLPKA
jgi:putative membrane protein